MQRSQCCVLVDVGQVGFWTRSAAPLQARFRTSLIWTLFEVWPTDSQLMSIHETASANQALLHRVVAPMCRVLQIRIGKLVCGLHLKRFPS